MQLQLIVPGLVWPNAGATGLTSGLTMPAFERLLGFAKLSRGPGMSLEHMLAAAFGLAPDALGFADLRRLGEDLPEPAAGTVILCADPVHLHFAREHLLLSDIPESDLSDTEARVLCESLNDFFRALEPDFIQFEVATNARWYLTLRQSVPTQFAPLPDVIGRPVKLFMPEGEDNRRWQRISNEIQVFLHNHEINAAREAAGKRAINSVWIWGSGTNGMSTQTAAPVAPVAPAPVIFARDPFARGLARRAGVPVAAPSGLPETDALIVLNDLQTAVLHFDANDWRQGLQALEDKWFAPLLAALKSRRATSLRVVVPGDRSSVEFTVRSRDLWRFWRAPASLKSLLPSQPT